MPKRQPKMPPPPEPRILVAPDPQCAHVWLIDTPSADVEVHSLGSCAKCGGKREFANHDAGAVKRSWNAMPKMRVPRLTR